MRLEIWYKIAAALLTSVSRELFAQRYALVVVHATIGLDYANLLHFFRNKLQIPHSYLVFAFARALVIYNTYITNPHYSPIVIHLHRIFDMLEKFITEVEADTGIPAAGNILHTP